MCSVAQCSGQVVPQLCLCPKTGTRWLHPRGGARQPCTPQHNPAPRSAQKLLLPQHKLAGGRAGRGWHTCYNKTLSFLSPSPPSRSQHLRDCNLLKKSCSRRWLCPVSPQEVSGEKDVCVHPLPYLNSLQRAVWAGRTVFTHRIDEDGVK